MLFAMLLFLLSGPVGPGQADPACESRPEACRRVAAFELRIGDKTYPVDLQEPRVWISDGRLTLYPGESAVVNIDIPGKPVVEAAAAGEVISDERAAAMARLLASGAPSEGADSDAERAGEPLQNQPGKRLRFTFRQAPDSEDMLLVVENQHATALSYDAGMLLLAGEELAWSATSVCTVQPGIFSIEHWPHPIMAISVGGFELAPSASEEVVCR